MTAKPPQRIAIACGPHMGDSIACLPMAGLLKQRWPQSRITGIGAARFKPLFEACPDLDDFLSTADAVADPMNLARLQLDVLLNPFPDLEVAIAAARAKVPMRIGNLRRSKLIPYCNKFVFYGRRDSDLHEAVLNLKELRALGIKTAPPLPELHRYLRLTRVKPLAPEWAKALSAQHFNLILHTRSDGNGREWPLQHFDALAAALAPERYRIFLTGLDADREIIREQCPALLRRAHVVELFGKLSIEQLLSFVRAADGLVASGTGPLHLAAALGIRALGVFPPRKPIDNRRWGPIGPLAETLALPGTGCTPETGGCPRKMRGNACACMQQISPAQVLERIQRWSSERMR